MSLELIKSKTGRTLIESHTVIPAFNMFFELMII